MKFITYIIVFSVFGCSLNPPKNMKLFTALNNKSTPIRGNIVKIPNGEFRYDFYDVYEKDSQFKYLESLKYQGGGESWEGIIYGAIKLSDPQLLDKVRFDPESDGLAIWSSSNESLEKLDAWYQ